MTLPHRRPKGAAIVLEERGYNTKGIRLEDILANHDDFKNEKCRVGHTCIFISKFLCELNPIERVWSQSKRYMRLHHRLTSTEHSSGAEERFLRASMPKLYVLVKAPLRVYYGIS